MGECARAFKLAVLVACVGMAWIGLGADHANSAVAQSPAAGCSMSTAPAVAGSGTFIMCGKSAGIPPSVRAYLDDHGFAAQGQEPGVRDTAPGTSMQPADGYYEERIWYACNSSEPCWAYGEIFGIGNTWIDWWGQSPGGIVERVETFEGYCRDESGCYFWGDWSPPLGWKGDFVSLESVQASTWLSCWCGWTYEPNCYISP